jgi:diguanylate cyclase (GGDEF)-like protein
MADDSSRHDLRWTDPAPWLTALAVGLFVLGLGFAAERLAVQSHEAVERAAVAKALAAMRGRVGSVLDANMQVGQGLADYVASSGDLASGEFQAIARNLLSHRSEVRRVALVHGTTITDVYPAAGNEAVVGMNLRDNPEQWPVLRHAIESGMPVLGPPIVPLQGGGLVLIARTPVHVLAQRGQSYRYWGIISTVIDFPAALQRAGLNDPLPVSLAIQIRDDRGGNAGVVFGDAAVLTGDPEVVDLAVPGGTWTLAAIPPGGWSNPTALTWSLRGGSLSLALFTGWIGALTMAQWRAGRPGRAGMAGHWGRDSATGLLNSAAFQSAGDIEVAHARRTGRSVAVLLVDIDRLRHLNSARGTGAGDHAVHAVGAVLAASMRPIDLVARSEGGGFAVLLVGTTVEGAALVADKVRRAIRAIALDDDHAQQVEFTVSIGVAVVRDYDQGLKDVLVRAGERLSAAKLAGRDRIAV